MLEELKNSTERSKKIEQLAQTLKAAGFARTDLQARTMAEEMVGVEASVQENFENQVYNKTPSLVIPKAMTKKSVEFEDIEEKRMKLEKEILELEEKKKIIQQNIRDLREKALNRERIIIQNEYDTPTTRIKGQQEQEYSEIKNIENSIDKPLQRNKEQIEITLSDLMNTELEELTPITYLVSREKINDLKNKDLESKKETESNEKIDKKNQSEDHLEEINNQEENNRKEDNPKINKNTEISEQNKEIKNDEIIEPTKNNTNNDHEKLETKEEKSEDELKPIDVSEESKVD
ncbi:MAG: hypothetical protein QXG00_04285, partial [Candidatus Woesearchaeota archaeon]